ncbi:MAG TPA: ParB/RepB/Spo0J family partition protein [Chloroflexota bacterium]|nr:ParB/RepB/Spo0J family partition protein [Chloroflexota bacterium]
MSPNRPDILAARQTARPLQRLEAHLGLGPGERSGGNAGDTSGAPQLREVPLAALWLRHQPRKLVPDTVLEALLAADRAQPAALLAELQRLAADETSSYAATLRGLHELAATIRVHGVLVPLRLAQIDDRYVIEEGHRRALAALLAGLDRVPAIVAPSASELLLAARQFVANDQRADLSALEKAAWLRDLVAKADRELRLRKGWPLDEPSFEALFERGEEEALEDGAAPAEAAPAPATPSGPAPDQRRGARGAADSGPPLIAASEWERHKGEVRAQVLSLTGLSLGRYYQLRQLNRICPEARELAAGLTERHLRPIVVLPPEGQVLVVRAILAHQVPANKVPTLVRALADGGAEALRRALAALGLPSARGRVASVHSRIQAIPADWPDRVRLLEQELATIKAPHARATRLAQLAEQLQRLEGLAAAYRAILQRHGVEGPRVDPASA